MADKSKTPRGLSRAFERFLEKHVKPATDEQVHFFEASRNRRSTSSMWNEAASAFSAISFSLDYDGLVGMIRQLAPQVIKWKKPVVISIGSATALLEIFLAKTFPAWRVVCVDFAQKMNEEGRRLAQKLRLSNIYFLTADAKKLPFKEFSVDYALCIGVWENLSEPERGMAIKELGQVLKPMTLANEQRIIVGTSDDIQQEVGKVVHFEGGIEQ
jgi:ubiquinone/menaquinone biosynthesis C-methylase UbiE